MEPVEPEYLLTLPDGTVKQTNPFTGTRVWTSPGRGNRPLTSVPLEVLPLTRESARSACAFCETRYAETPPEKTRLILADQSPGSTGTGFRQDSSTWSQDSSLRDQVDESCDHVQPGFPDDGESRWSPETSEPDASSPHPPTPEQPRFLDGADRFMTSTAYVERPHVQAADLHATVAEFRVIPNLFEILSYDYWHDNYGYQLPPRVATARDTYLSTPKGREHVVAVQTTKLRAAGLSLVQIAALGEEAIIAQATGFFGGGHDVVVARRHYTDDATDTSFLAGSGTLTPEEHSAYIALTVADLERLYNENRYARYVAIFQNWLKPAGASFDHLHKQLVAVDEHGENVDETLPMLRRNPNLYNDAGTNYASRRNLLIAQNDGAVAYAGFGHRFPTVEIYSLSAAQRPFEHLADEVRAMSDLIHAIHAATGPAIATNEEWHHTPADVNVPMPWRVNVKWRVSNVAGFEGDTRIYINTISPVDVRDICVTALYRLRDEGKLADGIRIATECSGAWNLLRYC